MSVKLYFPWSHLDPFSKNCGDFGRALPRLVGFKLSHWILLVLETGHDGCWAQEKTYHSRIASFAYFSVYHDTMWAFSEYISPKFSIICLMQQENGYNTVLYISSKSLYLKNLIWLQKMSMLFGFSVKNCLKISHYIFYLENIAGQCNTYYNWICKNNCEEMLY